MRIDLQNGNSKMKEQAKKSAMTLIALRNIGSAKTFKIRNVKGNGPFP